VALHDLAGFERGRFAVSRFANQELHAELETDPAGQVCVVLGAVAPPDEHLLATLLLCHTLKKEGARTVIALLPYLGYARHDKAEPRKSRATAWFVFLRSRFKTGPSLGGRGWSLAKPR